MEGLLRNSSTSWRVALQNEAAEPISQEAVEAAVQPRRDSRRKARN
eukprot:CAMPEP_0206425402 /NCGR_PEP_ID=MMETSP0324_2-20121206/3769_1 /ASSEMBLY_ACC=CAM_ASM_000836 /TAXON_ID=2866 /ORGANISM="Crypthecodinium cohnii, Strain Seligo" /LENGTH=45 /DNA_ID= /DNA_START= /DNA_END= /DNA_ORIENTATION=